MYTEIMDGSILIYGESKEKRWERAKELLAGWGLENSANNPDILIADVPEDKKSIGIDQAREVKTFLQKKPFSHTYKAVIVKNADRLTTEAQNALLKVLEEPPIYANIILLTKTESALLPTVISRCQKVPLNAQRVGEWEYNADLRELLTMSKGERLAWAEEKSKEEREDIITLLEEWTYSLHVELEKNLLCGPQISTMLEVKEDLEKTNVNLKLALEYLCLNL